MAVWFCAGCGDFDIAPMTELCDACAEDALAEALALDLDWQTQPDTTGGN